MRKDSGISVGPGFYVAEDLHSSRRFGDTIIQIEVNEGIKYIDLTNREILKKNLKDKGIDVKNV